MRHDDDDDGGRSGSSDNKFDFVTCSLSESSSKRRASTLSLGRYTVLRTRDDECTTQRGSEISQNHATPSNRNIPSKWLSGRDCAVQDDSQLTFAPVAEAGRSSEDTLLGKGKRASSCWQGQSAENGKAQQLFNSSAASGVSNVHAHGRALGRPLVLQMPASARQPALCP